MSFSDDVKEMRRLMKANMHAGTPKQAMAKSKEEFKALQAARIATPTKSTVGHRHVRTFMTSFIFGAIWSSFRRR